MDPRSKIQDFQDFHHGSKKSFLEILDLGSISHSDLSQTWNLKEMLVIYFYCIYYVSYIDLFGKKQSKKTNPPKNLHTIKMWAAFLFNKKPHKCYLCEIDIAPFEEKRLSLCSIPW